MKINLFLFSLIFLTTVYANDVNIKPSTQVNNIDFNKSFSNIDFPRSLNYIAVISDNTKLANKKRHKVIVSYFEKNSQQSVFVESFKRVNVSKNEMEISLGQGLHKNRWFHRKDKYSSLYELFSNNREVQMQISIDGIDLYPKVGILPAGHSQETAMLSTSEKPGVKDKHWKGFKRKSSVSSFQSASLSSKKASSASKQVRKHPYEIETIGPMLSLPLREILRNLPVSETLKVNDNVQETNKPRHENLFDSQGRRYGTIAPTQNDRLAIDSQSISGPSLLTPALSVGFEGMPRIDGVLPPDTEIVVGPSHIVQMVNSQMQIFDKAGNSLSGPSPINSLWAGFGGRCESDNNGDPIAMFDEQADKWVLTQFAVAGAPESVCFAVSTTNNPLGAYNRYQIITQRFPDYFKLGIWPAANNNAYLMGTNSGLANQYDVYAIDRENMLLGNALRPTQYFQSFQNLFIPADNDGFLPPSANEPGYFYTILDSQDSYFNPSPANDTLQIGSFNIDWTTPANSSFAIQNVTSANGLVDFNWTVCGFFVGNCIEQPSSSVLIDSNSWWPQQRFQYRNFGIYGSLVGTWGVNAVASPGKRTAPRWFEFRKYTPDLSWTLRQQGTYSPDATHRFSPSISMDESQNIGLGYSVTSASVFPGIRYTVHDNDLDNLGVMEAEAVMVNGGGSQSNSSGRWGDYASMDVDPVDSCTFWFSTEYYASDSSANWRTYIGSFKVPTCKKHNILIYDDYTDSHDINVCQSAGSINYQMALSYNFNTPTAMSVSSGCPAGATCSFTNSPVTYPTDPILQISNLGATAPGSYALTVNATDGGAKTDTETFNLNVLSSSLSLPSLSSPLDGLTNVSLSPTFSWVAVSGASGYDIDIATDPSFLTIVDSASTTTNSYSPAALSNATVYYWRVRAKSSCGMGNYNMAAFETAAAGGVSTTTYCSAANLNVAIPDNSVAGVDNAFSIAATGTISDINITLNISHTWVGDLVANVQSNTTTTNVTVLDRPGYTGTGNGCSRNNINTSLDDSAATPVEGVCPNANPTIGAGPFSPNNPLSAFNSENVNGVWTLNVSDRANSDAGTLNQWCVVATVNTGGSITPADYSDLNSSYGVAKHEGGGGFKLGANWTADSGFSQDSDTADDDGIVASGSWEVGSLNANINATVNSAGYLACWFDWNNDGSFASGEQSIGQSIGTGGVDIAISIPATSTFGLTATGDTFLETRCRFYDAVQARAPASPVGTSTAGEVEDYRFPENQLTPVTLAYTYGISRQQGFSLNWSTTTEAGTIGFNVYGLDKGVWVLLNNLPISAKGINSISPNDYQFTLQNSQIESYKIQELTTKGIVHDYGPYIINKSYGKYPNLKSINWDPIKQESVNKANLRQENLITRFNFIKVNVNKTGIQRVTYEQLLATGANWQGINADDISVSFEGVAVARKVSNTVFGPGSYVDFVGVAADTLYTKINVYELKLDSSLVLKQKINNNSISSLDTAAYYIASTGNQNDVKYSFAAPGDSPWFLESMLVYTNENTWNYPINADNLINNGVMAKLNYRAWGGTDWSATTDHHLQVLLNNQIVSDVYTDGLEIIDKTIALNFNQVSALNTITFKLPADTGVDYDLMQLDYYTLNYPSEIFAINDSLSFTPIVDTYSSPDVIYSNGFEASTLGFAVKGFSSADITAYAFDGVNLYEFAVTNPVMTNSLYDLNLPTLSSNTFKYFVSGTDKINQPSLELATDMIIDLSQSYDYLMITHPDFSSVLSQLVNYHQAKGLNVLVTDVNDIYAQYSYHRKDAQAIKTFIQEAASQTGINSVLLVGSDTYDYLDNLAIGSISFMPTLYYATDNLIKYAPVDSLFADTNNDLIPDLALGRLPVRNSIELQNSINKIIAFDNRTYIDTAVFASDRNLSFDEFSNQMIDLLPINWQVDKAYINDLDVIGAQSSLINSMASGVSLTSFFGHSGPSTWSFEHLFDNNDILALSNINMPTMVSQFGCWNTYYVMPEHDTMAHNFMSIENKGAVSVLGASTLTQSFHESMLGNILIPMMTQVNLTTGMAIQQAKAELALKHPDYLDVILGWTLLGDPMIILNQE